MSAIDFNRAVPLGSVPAFRFVTLVERGIHALGSWRRARATSKALSDLSDQQLEDIGLMRGDIAVLARRLARR